MLESLNLIKRNTFYLAIVVVFLAAFATWKFPEPESDLKPDDQIDIISPQFPSAIKEVKIGNLAIANY